MEMIRSGIANVDMTTGATVSNVSRAISMADDMAQQGCAIGVFPEALFGGYPGEDLSQFGEFAAAQWRGMRRFANATHHCNTVFFAGIVVHDMSGQAYNACAVFYRGEIVAIVPKEHMPEYNVFYEGRVFSSGFPGLNRALTLAPGNYAPVPFGDFVFEFPFGPVATGMCEDTWTPDGPMLRRSGQLIHVTCHSSPARHGVPDTRAQMLATRSADHEIVLIAAYQVGANDSLVFDGGGFFFQNGQLLKKAESFREGVTICDIDLSRTKRMRRQNTTWRNRQKAIAQSENAPHVISVTRGPDFFRGPLTPEFARRFGFLPSDPAERERALAYDTEVTLAGLAGYFEKAGVFKRVCISLSGGKDSELTLIYAVLYARRKFAHLPQGERAQAIKDFIICVSQPSRFNSDATKSIARISAEELGATLIEESIEEEYELELSKLRKMAGLEPTALVKGNMQARIRSKRMRNLANVFEALWLHTGNMSEKAVGYSTVGGDLDGDFSLIGNKPKTVVSMALEYLARTYGIAFVAQLLLTRASAELEEGQFDEDDLMPYEVLDLCLVLFFGELYSPADMYRVVRARWTDEELVAMCPSLERKAETDISRILKAWVEKFIRRCRMSVYKWVVSPLAVHLGTLDLDRERALQIPVITSDEWLEESLREMHAIEQA